MCTSDSLVIGSLALCESVLHQTNVAHFVPLLAMLLVSAISANYVSEIAL
jgi:hypothetical protein